MDLPFLTIRMIKWYVLTYIADYIEEIPEVQDCPSNHQAHNSDRY